MHDRKGWTTENQGHVGHSIFYHLFPKSKVPVFRPACLGAKIHMRNPSSNRNLRPATMWVLRQWILGGDFGGYGRRVILGSWSGRWSGRCDKGSIIGLGRTVMVWFYHGTRRTVSLGICAGLFFFFFPFIFSECANTSQLTTKYSTDWRSAIWKGASNVSFHSELHCFESCFFDIVFDSLVSLSFSY